MTLASGPHAQALWTKDGAAVVYPCHAVIVVLRIDTREQCFFLGHTDKVGTAWPRGGLCLQATQLLLTCRPPGLCPGIGWEQLAAGLSPGTASQRAAPLGLPDQGLPVSVPEPRPHCLLPQVGEGPLRGVGASPASTDCLLHVHSFSDSGALLCCVGKDHHGKTVMVGWGLSKPLRKRPYPGPIGRPRP